MKIMTYDSPLVFADDPRIAAEVVKDANGAVTHMILKAGSPKPAGAARFF